MVTVRQQVPLGLGHAIWCARAFIGDDPFAVLLPDDLVLADTPCLQQLADAYRETGGNVVAVTEVPREQTNRYGILRHRQGRRAAGRGARAWWRSRPRRTRRRTCRSSAATC